MATVGSGNSFPAGQCTWWADFRYHALTGKFVSWGGDAHSWASGAQGQGWTVSNTPPPPGVPAIVVLQPFIQGAGSLGHVAVIEGTNSDGSVRTSNLNWAGNQNPANPSYVNFHAAPGVSFVWYPGAGQAQSVGIPPGITANPNTPAATPTDTSGLVTGIQDALVHTGLFLVALVLVFFGFYLLFQKQVNTAAGQAVDVAKKAVMFA